MGVFNRYEDDEEYRERHGLNSEGYRGRLGSMNDLNMYPDDHRFEAQDSLKKIAIDCCKEMKRAGTYEQLTRSMREWFEGQI